MIVNVAVLQYPLGRPITLEDKLLILRHRPDFVCLPEYCFVGPDCRGIEEAARATRENVATIEKLSIDLATTVIGGSIIIKTDGGYANTAMIFSRGRLVGSHQKVNLYGNEPRRGIVPGRKIVTFVIDEVLIVFVCHCP